MKIPVKIFGQLVELILRGNAVKVTKYYDEKTVVKAKRKVFNGRIDKRSRIVEIQFTLGAPNFAERKFIKLAKKANEPFPIKKVQIKYAN